MKTARRWDGCDYAGTDAALVSQFNEQVPQVRLAKMVSIEDGRYFIH